MSDWDRVVRAKERHRDEVRNQPFADKLRVLERLREREGQLRQLRGPRVMRVAARPPVLVPGGTSQGACRAGGRPLHLMGADAILLAVMTGASRTRATTATVSAAGESAGGAR